jgi:hypothetical protein
VIAWSARPSEERALLNPAFLSAVLWHAAGGYSTVASAPMPLDLAFLVGPFVLHRDTRESLPRAVTTSLAVWLDDNSLTRARAGGRARALVAHTKEALLFGGMHGLLDLSGGNVLSIAERARRVNAVLKRVTEEVRQCMKRSEFVGRWFASAGSPGTVMALIGVRA